MKLREANCGHWIDAEVPATDVDVYGHPVYLCPECKAKIIPFETKVVKRGPGRPKNAN